MRILLNATDGPLSVRAVRRYVSALAAGLARAPEVELHLLFLTHRRALVRRFLGETGCTRGVHVHAIPLPRAWAHRRYDRPRWEMRRLADRVDLYHETTVDHPDLEGAVPYLTTIHGLLTLVRPELCDPAFVAEKAPWFERAVARSTHFVPVSETTRREFLDRYDVAPERVRAVPLGVDEAFRPGDPEVARRAVRARFGVEGRYLLYVGGVQRNKNIPRLLATARALRDRGVLDAGLVLAGDVHYRPEEFRALVREHDLEGAVRTTGYLEPDDPALIELYRGAELFLFPTHYEGWTSPPLEALGCGTPVLASDASSVPETLGDAACFAPPEDAEAWVEGATRLLGDAAYRAELRERGLARARAFTWDRTVGRTVDLYRGILEGDAGVRGAGRVETVLT